MSWHYLQEGEEASWEESCLDGAPSVLSRLIPTVDQSFLPDNEMGSSPSSRSGMMSEPSMESPGKDQSMSYREDFLASHSREQAEEDGEQKTSGLICSASCAMSDQLLLLPKTFNENQSAGQPETCEGRGIWLDVLEYPPPSWVPQLDDQDIGWLPSPTTKDNQQCDSMQKWPAQKRLSVLSGGKRLGLTFWEWIMGLPIG